MEQIHTENSRTTASKAIANQSGTVQGKNMPAVPVLQTKEEPDNAESPLQLESAQLSSLGGTTAPTKAFTVPSRTAKQAPSQLKPFQLQHDDSKKEESVENSTVQTPFILIQRKENNTGLPDNLKNGVENLSGFTMDDVKVHYNSDKPAQLQALAYAQGTDIHIAPGQEQHLPHEAWHVAQQKQGRVQATTQLKSNVAVNDDKGLEQEADAMGANALTVGPVQMMPLPTTISGQLPKANNLVSYVYKPIVQKLEMDEDDKHPDATTRGQIDATETLAEIATDEFMANHVSDSPENAQTRAAERLVSQHFINISTMLIMNEGDQNTLRDELMYRNHIEFFDEHDGPHRCNFPISYVTVTRGEGGAENTVERGERHFNYSVIKNGRVWILAHFATMGD